MPRSVSLKITNCMDCPNHEVVRDPDPTDSFCSDDEAVLCTKAPNTKKITQWYSNVPFEHRPITTSCRPYKKREECEIPNWCPLSKG
jgi:hypothetical protein